MKILVFLHGTAIMQAAGVGRSREERVRQVIDGEPSVGEYSTYVPVGDAARKLRMWRDQGAEILYLSSHRDADDVYVDARVLNSYGFPLAPVHFRQPGEDY